MSRLKLWLIVCVVLIIGLVVLTILDKDTNILSGLTGIAVTKIFEHARDRSNDAT